MKKSKILKELIYWAINGAYGPEAWEAMAKELNGGK